jgi:hypothetical protein
MRAFPNPDREKLVRLPINVSDAFERFGYRPARMNGRGLALEQAFSAFEGQQVVTEVYAVGLELRGLVERVDLSVEELPELGSATRILWMQVRGKRIYEAAGYDPSPTAGLSLGQQPVGASQLGSGEEIT